MRMRLRAGACLSVVIVLLVGMPSSPGVPTLATITIDGSMADWSGVLANPDNTVLDGPGGGLSDADTPNIGAIDLHTVAWTWDTTWLYFYVRRTGTSGQFNYLWLHFDLDDDGLVADTSPLLAVAWWGTNRKITTSLDRYRSAGAAGDPVAGPSGSHDGYRLPGTRQAGIALETLTAGTASGLEAEFRVSWASLGVAPGTALRFHISTSRRINDYPQAIADNAGAGTAYAAVILSPDRSVGAPPGGQLVLAHTVTNAGNVTDTFDLSWSVTGAFAPIGLTFHHDADASGTLTAGDTPLTDTDGDGVVDTGPMAGPGTTLPVLAVAGIPTGASLGQVAAITLVARSTADPTVSDTAVDTVTIGGPSLTLLKSVSAASAPPGSVLTWTVTYSNTGTSDAIAVEIVDPVPAGTTYVAGSSAGAGVSIVWSHDGGASWDATDAAPVTHVRWTRAAALPPGAAGSVSFQATID